MNKKLFLKSLLFIPIIGLLFLLRLSLKVENTPKVIKANKNQPFLFQTKNTSSYTAGFGSKQSPDLSLLKIEAKGQTINITPEIQIEKTEPEGNDKIVSSGKDIKFVKEVLEYGVKEDIILNKPVEQISYKFDSGSLVPQKIEEEWHFLDENSESRFYIPKPFMVDTNNVRSEDVEIQINGDKILVIPDQDWLNADDRAYPVRIDPSLMLTILTVHSHPQTGDNWVVDFETEGQSELKIIPDDQDTIEDLDFVSLKCGEKEISPQILDSDVIYVDNWQCDNQTAQVNHYVNLAAPHTLRFEFGGQTAYAYNAPSVSTYTFTNVTQSTDDYFAYEDYGSASFTGPDDTGTSEATNTDYSNISSDNSTSWTTDGATTDSHYDAQLYKFYVDESENAISQLDFKWNGYGETESGYNTTFYAWDYTNSQWTQLSQVDFTSTTEQNLTFSETTNPGDYIDTDGEVVLMAETVKYVNPYQYARPSSDIGSDITWTTESSGTTNIYTSIDEETASDTDYIYSQANKTGYYETGLSSVTDPASSTGHTVRWRSKDSSTKKTLSATMGLYQGTTLIASQSQAISDTITTYTYTLTGTEADSITDYTDLRIRFTITSNGGGGNEMEVYWAELEVPNI